MNPGNMETILGSRNPGGNSAEICCYATVHRPAGQHEM
jgi:hypothetical protein